MVLVEQGDIGDAPVAELRAGGVTEEGLLRHLGGHVDALRCRLAEGRGDDNSHAEHHEYQETR
jgi:hypothetical protein